MKSIRRSAVVALTLTAFVASGCGGSSGSDSAPTTNSTELSTTFQTNEQPRDAIEDGGTLTTAVPEITPQFNTFEADGTLYTSEFWKWYNPNLMLFAPDGTATPDPDYITGYDKAETGGKTVVTYTINPDAVFNDGTPIEWTAFETTWKANNGEDEAFQPSSTDGYSQIESVVQGTDAKQAVVTFKGVYAWVDGLFNLVLNPAAGTADVFNKGYVDEPHPEWGAGPFTLDTYDKQSGTISFKRNPMWWGDPGKLDSRVYKALEDTASINAFKAGQLDATSVATKDRLAQVKDMQDIDIRRSASPSQNLLTLNAGHANLADLDVRKAVFMGIDRGVIGKIEFNGLDYTEEPPGSFSLYPFQKGYVDNLGEAGYTYDPAAAGDLLETAGWVKGDGEYRTKDGQPLTLSYAVIGDDPTTQAEAKAVVSMLKEIGIEVTIDQHPNSEFSDVFNKGQFDIFGLGFSSSDPFGFAYFCQIWCSDSGLNVSQTSTKEIDVEAKALAEVGDPAEQIAQGNILEQKIMAETYGIMPTTNGPTIIATKKNLANYGADLFGVGRVQDIGFTK